MKNEAWKDIKDFEGYYQDLIKIVDKLTLWKEQKY
jgi:hypothetical protein